VDFFSSNASAIVLVLVGLCLLMIVMMQSMQVSKLRLRIDQLTGGVEGGDLEAVLGEHLETVHQVGRDLDELTARMAFVESSARHHFAKEGLVRFNPFPDTGGNQSFALALLDESDDGFVLSSLHSRTGTRIYAKAVAGGKADTSLSAEEQEAIDTARAKRTARAGTPPRSAAASRQAQAAATTPAPAPAAPAPTPAPVAPPVVAPASKAVVEPAPLVRVVAAPPVKATPARAVVSQPEEVDEGASKPLSKDRGKGGDKPQEKPKDLVSGAATAGADSEKVDRKPGQRPAHGSR
jgi:Protein of unknown function (DUF4446)